MSIYQAMQLNAAGSKESIRTAETKQEKRKYIIAYVLKLLATVIFCFTWVTVFSILFGADNSIAGVVILLALLVLRQADFGIRTSHGIIVIFLLFGILAAGPKLSNMVAPVPAFFINAFCILSIMVLACHNVIMSNQSTFVLGYLLLQGYDVSGSAFHIRLLGLFLGAVICAIIFYVDQKNRVYRRTLKDLFLEFDIHTHRTQWYLRLTIGVSSALLLGSLLHFPRVMWIGISAMSVLLPFKKDLVYRVKRRAPWNVIGCAGFFLLYNLIPESLYPYIGILGGIGVGLSASYSWQTFFNTFGALAVATNMFGLGAAILLRIVGNAFGSLYAAFANHVLSFLKERWDNNGCALNDTV